MKISVFCSVIAEFKLFTWQSQLQSIFSDIEYVTFLACLSVKVKLTYILCNGCYMVCVSGDGEAQVCQAA